MTASQDPGIFFFNLICIRILPYVHEIQEQQNYILVLNTTSAR